MPELLTPEQNSSTTTRRDMLRAAGLGGAALLLAGCAKGSVDFFTPSGPTRAVTSSGGIVLDFSSDIDVLNYAYALEQLEAAFYTLVASNAAFTTAFAQNEQRLLLDVRDHEITHRDFLGAVLGTSRIPNLTPKFGTVDFTSRTSVLQTARTFEDLGVSAYNGAARYITNTTYLGIAGKIVTVEGRHAAAIRDALSPRGSTFAPSAFDDANTPQTVLSAAGPFIVENITVINT